MLAKLCDRARHGQAVPEQAWPETGGSRILVLARRDPETQTVILVMDAAADMASTPSLLTLMNEKPTFARSSGLARSCPGAPMADATARPSPSAPRGSPPACGPSPRPTGSPLSATQRSSRITPYFALLSASPTGKWSWSK